MDNVASAATITSDGYGRILTVDNTNYSGTAAGSNPDTVNLEVLAVPLVQRQLPVWIFITDNASTIETLNVTSSGSAANVFSLDASTNVTLSTSFTRFC